MTSASTGTPAANTPPRRTMAYNQLSSCPDMEPAFVEMYEQTRADTLTSLERMYGLYKAIEHIGAHGIDGDIVECGTWRGGSCMLAALALISFNDTERSLYLYDTFEGMTEPTDEDVDYNDEHAALRLNDRYPSFRAIANAPLEQVRQNMLGTGYPPDRIVLVKGRVEQTMPATAPQRIAVLRLDTDWYESTRHELDHLFPRLVSGGVLIIDDYGHWKGARRAVDEYLAEHHVPMMLHRVDYTGRFGIKP